MLRADNVRHQARMMNVQAQPRVIMQVMSKAQHEPSTSTHTCSDEDGHSTVGPFLHSWFHQLTFAKAMHCWYDAAEAHWGSDVQPIKRSSGVAQAWSQSCHGASFDTRCLPAHCNALQSVLVWANTLHCTRGMCSLQAARRFCNDVTVPTSTDVTIHDQSLVAWRTRAH